MNVDSNNHCKERITLSGMYSHIMQVVVIEYSVINPFGSSTIVIDLFVLFRTPCNRCIESDIPGGFGVDAPSVRGIGAALAGITFFLFATGCRTTPFAAAASGAESPVDHAETGLTDGCAIGINADMAGNCLGYPAIGIEVNKRADTPGFAEVIGRIVIMSRVQTKVFDRNIGIEGAEFPQGNEQADAVMPPGPQKTDVKRQIRVNHFIMIREHVKSMAEKIAVFITVPAPGSIRIRVVTSAGTGIHTVLGTFTDPVSIRR